MTNTKIIKSSGINPFIPTELNRFELLQIQSTPEKLVLEAKSLSRAANCPKCGILSQSIHSHYWRSPHDLALNAKSVQLKLHLPRFRCKNQQCSKVTFNERLPDLVLPYAQRTKRLNQLLQTLALALGGEGGARLGEQLKIGVSGTTLLRLIYRTPTPSPAKVRVLGVDDFAFKRGKTYGTVLVDLEQHKVIDLLADRSAKTLADWLVGHPELEVIARDRSHDYAFGILCGAPHVQQVADRWHLLKNWREMVERVFNRLHKSLQANWGGEGEPLRGRSKRLQLAAYHARERRLAVYNEVKQLHQQGLSMLAIATKLKMGRDTVRKFVRAESFPERAVVVKAPSKLDPYRAELDQLWQSGIGNGRELYRQIKEVGYGGDYKAVQMWLAVRRTKPGRLHSEQEKARLAQNPAEILAKETGKENKPEGAKVSKLAAPRHLAWLLVQKPADLSVEKRQILDFLCEDSQISQLYRLSQQFVTDLKERNVANFEAWLRENEKSEIAELVSFSASLRKDYGAVKAAFSSPYSNGQTEGQVNRLKLIKRQMYGRASFELLRQRVLAA